MLTIRRPWFMPLVRKLHLWSGLFMLPWVLLYGLTAFLFNHPSAMPDRPLGHFSADVLQGTPMAQSPSPAQMAELVVAQLNRESPKSLFRLVNPDKVTTSRDVIFATVAGDELFINVALEPTGKGGTFTHRPVQKPAEKAPFARTSADKIVDSWDERAKQSVPKVLERLNLPTGIITVTSTPEVTFFMEQEGKVWKATYQPITGALSGKLADDPEEPLSWRRYLLKLHTAHGYPWTGTVRIAWAVIVDMTFIAMIFWAISGILMWWQLKSVRWTGALSLIAGLIAAVVTFAGMAVSMR